MQDSYIDSDTFKAFSDEMKKIAIDPMAAAGAMAAGKIMLSNTLGRHAASIRPLRWIGQEIAGVGARTAMQGKPMLSRPFREALATTVDPKLVGLYEHAHSAGNMIKNHPGAVSNAQQVAQQIQQLPGAKNFPAVMRGADFVGNIPLESKGIRKVIDYGFTPVSQVGRDIKGAVSGLFKRRPAPVPAV